MEREVQNLVQFCFKITWMLCYSAINIVVDTNFTLYSMYKINSNEDYKLQILKGYLWFFFFLLPKVLNNAVP